MFAQLLNWLSELGEKITGYVLDPYMALPGYFKCIILIAVAFLSVVGLINVAKRALKTVVGIACAFIVLLIIWIIFA